MSDMELNYTNGSLSAFCSRCGEKLDKTTTELQELSEKGSVNISDVICAKCNMKIKVELQLGKRETGVIK